MLRSNTVQSVHGMLQQKRSMAAPCAGLSCTEKTRQHSSARPSMPYPTWRSHPEAQRTTCHSHDQVLLVVQVPARRASRALWRLSSRRGSYAGTHRRAGCSRSEESTCGRHLRGVLEAHVGVRRDKVGPKFVTERSTHLLGNAPEQPAPALLCVLACHLGQFDRVGGLVRTQAMSRHPRHNSIASPGLAAALRTSPVSPLC